MKPDTLNRFLKYIFTINLFEWRIKSIYSNIFAQVIGVDFCADFCHGYFTEFDMPFNL